MSKNTLSRLIESHASERPHAIAISAPARLPLTYEGLYQQIIDVREQLGKLAIGRGDSIALVLPNGPEMAVAFCAVAAAAISAPLNPGYRASEYEFYFSDLNASALIVMEGVESESRAVAQTLGIPIIDLSPRLDGPAGLFDLNGGATATPAVSKEAVPDDVALVLHTSGTTSRPKIVPLTHGNICTSAANIAETLELSSDDRCLNVMPLFHIHGLIGATLSSLFAGAGIVCTPGFDEHAFFQWLGECCPTWYSAVPTMHQAILARASNHREIVGESKLRLIRSSSASLPPQVMAGLEEQLGVPVIESYGMTEAAHQMTSNPLPPALRKAGTVGLAAGPDVAIMDENGILLPQGQIGEIVIRGDNVTHGYENNPVANADAFIGAWFRTGDQGQFDAEGYLTITGRLKEIINRGGEKIAPREVDEVLLAHPDVMQAVTFAVPHPTLGQDVAAAVVVQPNGNSPTTAALRDFAFSNLADFKVPSQIVIVDQVPKGPTGKLQRIGLADMLEAELSTEYEAPRTELEMTLCQIWCDVLAIERVGIHDNFFMIGGDSIQAAQIFVEIERRTGKNGPLAALFRAPTIAELANVIQGGEWSTLWSSLVPIQPNGSKRPFFCVHAHGGNVIGYANLAAQLGPDQPFYGLQSQYLDGEVVRELTIEGMASHYLGEIRHVQRHGPYRLGGWCMGGILAYEMAQQLQAADEEVEFLALIQAFHPAAGRRRRGSTQSHHLTLLALNRARFELHNIRNVDSGGGTRHIQKRVQQTLTTLQVQFEQRLPEPFARSDRQRFHSELYRLGLLEAAHTAASVQYHPRPYSGDVVIFRAKQQPLWLQPQHTLGWDEVVQGKLTVHEIEGYRSGMLSSPQVEILGEHIRSHLGIEDAGLQIGKHVQ